jgi:hypothetical protein
VVKGAIHADFHGVTLHRLFATFESEQFRARGGARSPGRQSSAEHVSHFNELFVVTDRTRLTGRATDIFRRAQQLGVSVADIFVTKQAGRDLGQESVADQSKLNDCAVGGAGAKTLIH